MSDREFTELVENHGARVLNTAFRVLGNRQAAEDVHQDVFMSIWRLWHTFNGHTKWNSYLYRATIRKAIDNAKSMRKRAVKEAEVNLAQSGRADERLITDEMTVKLRKGIAKLPGKQAQVFVMSRLEGLSYEEIADNLECSASTVRVHHHRAMRSLAKEFVDYKRCCHEKTR